MSEEEKKAIEKLKEYALCKVNDNGYVEVSANGYKHTILNLIDDVLNHLTKQEKMIENAKDSIEYYLMGNSTLNDFNEREKELEKLLNILKNAGRVNK